MEVIKDFIPEGRQNRPAGKNKLQYIAVHNTDNYSVGANALNHAQYLKTTDKHVSWHFTVDDTNVVQHLPVEETAYHATDGMSGLGNTSSIGVEICVNADGDIKKATLRAVELIRYLCDKYNIPVDGVVQHNFFYNKNCPKELRAGNPVSWVEFIEMVNADRPSTWAQEACAWAVEEGIVVGNSSSDYGWKDTITKEQMATMLYRYHKLK